MAFYEARAIGLLTQLHPNSMKQLPLPVLRFHPVSALAAILALAGPALAQGQAIEPVRLQSREFSPAPGVDPALRAAAIDAGSHGATSFHFLAQLAVLPAPAQCQAWAVSGIHLASYVHGKNYIVRVPLGAAPGASIDAAAAALGATACTLVAADDRIPQALDERLHAPPGPAIEPVVLLAMFHSTADEAACFALVAPFGGAVGLPPEQVAPRTWKFTVYSGFIDPVSLDTLLASDLLHFLSEGPLEMPTMDVTRRENGADKVQGLAVTSPLPVYTGYTGRTVKLSNGEGLDSNHDDFWNHDSSGNRTTPRWTGCETGNMGHGTMTAGIMLGNGWRSAAAGFAPFQFRGMAPEATFTCQYTGEDASNRSFADTVGPYNGTAAWVDSAVRGDGLAATFHPIVYAAANQGFNSQGPAYGVEKGYYSILSPYKNSIVVGNLHKSDLTWAGSSLGPTWDGRIKPDIAAPGTERNMPDGLAAVALDLDYVRVSGGTAVNWEFNTPGPAWKGSWGVNGYWEQAFLGPITHVASSILSTSLLQGNWNLAWDGSPMIGTLMQPDGVTPLAVDGTASDVVTVRYRLGNVPQWTSSSASIGFSVLGVPPDQFIGGNYVGFPVMADGNWHTASVPVGTHPNWAASTAVNPVHYIIVRFRGLAAMNTTAYSSNAYGGAGGSSAAAPVVTGALGLLMEQMKSAFGVVLGTKTASPFAPAPGTGDPLSSTYKALLIHTADDLASWPHPLEAANPDTGVQTVYHKGPDLATGYGNANVGEASRLLRAEAASPGLQFVHEGAFTSYTVQTYTVTVPPGQTDPLRVTLAWDDAAGSPMAASPVSRLVNDLDLELIAPNTSVRYPWTVDLPYQPLSGPVAQYPDMVEPEPITAASIKAARRDIPDHRNNVEQVCVEAPAAGVWTVRIIPASLPVCQPPQRYSLIVGMPPTPQQDLTCGKVVFSSDRGQGRELFVKQVGFAGPPLQITNSSFTPQHPAWSPDGRHIAYIDRTIIVGPSVVMHALFIVSPTGGGEGFFPALPTFGTYLLGYPEWSPDGKRIVVTAHNTWGDRRLIVMTFNTAYNFNGGYTTQVVVPAGTGAGDADFSPDGQWLYYNTDVGASGNVRRVPVAGGTPEVIYTNGTPMSYAYALSVSPDGRRLLYNSENWRLNPVTWLDEEVLVADMLTGVSIDLTHESGNQYGKHARGGSGEYVMQSNATTSGNTDIFLATHNKRVKLDIADPTNLYADGEPDWWKGAPGFQTNDTAYVPAAMSICNTQTFVDVPVTICNASCVAHAWQYTARGLPGVGAVPFVPCGVDGPTSFSYLGANPVFVPAKGCVTVTIRMGRPLNLNALNLRACFAIDFTELNTGATMTKTGEIVDTGALCIQPCDNCNPMDIQAGVPTSVGFNVTNNGTTPVELGLMWSGDLAHGCDPYVVPPGATVPLRTTVVSWVVGQLAEVSLMDSASGLQPIWQNPQHVFPTRTVPGPDGGITISSVALDDCRSGMQWVPGAAMVNRDMEITYGGFGIGKILELEESQDLVHWTVIDVLPPVPPPSGGPSTGKAIYSKDGKIRGFVRIRECK